MTKQTTETLYSLVSICPNELSLNFIDLTIGMRTDDGEQIWFIFVHRLQRHLIADSVQSDVTY